MTINELEALFETEDPLRSKGVNYRDWDAFLRLAELGLLSTRHDLISAAEHDIIWLRIDCAKLALAAENSDIHFLKACGVHFDPDSESLYMNV